MTKKDQNQSNNTGIASIIAGALLGFVIGYVVLDNIATGVALALGLGAVFGGADAFFAKRKTK